MHEVTNVSIILFMAAFGGLFIGLNLASMTGILDVMIFSSDPDSPFQRELVTFVMPFGSILGALISSYIVDQFGVSSPLRGAILLLLYVLIGTGILSTNGIQFMATRLIGRTVPGNDEPEAVVSALRVSFILQIIPGLVFMMFALTMPESPYRLASRGHWREAHGLMAALEDGTTTDPKVLAHYEQMRAEIQARRGSGRPRLLMLFHASERSKLVLGVYHATHVLASAGIVWYPLAVSLVYLFNVIAAMAGSSIADIWGRRLTLMSGSIVMIACLMIMGIIQVGFAELNLGYFEDPFFDNLVYVIRNPSVSNTMLAFVSLSVVTYAATWGPTSWAYSTEIFPTYLRSRGVALCTASFWVGNCIMTLAVPSMLNFVAFLHALAGFRETQGGPLEEMDDLFNSEDFAWHFQARGVKFNHLVSRFENDPSVVGNAARDADRPAQEDIELGSMDGNTITNVVAV
ncbi:uncharacterized protein Triagg1_10966 [Trichoderma aggressivum f. europaeum]|uniref:Major facilitator superfamily (MFS) profile domain-containing protein n=1 Tax=Trichoderma aggressivum f. europaeum TaxID=173218 RepID=A0AAE1I507_9HYPO|nr:hypothetical protein Triagg1_10966 [Trichoderma aggressivum f. europaeum]